MTLQDLFINLKYKYDNSGLRTAKRETEELDKGIQEVDESVERLNASLIAIGTAAVAGVTVGIAAYSRFSDAMVEFTGKSGMALANFKEFTSEAQRISRNTGAPLRSVIEGMQRTYSLSGDRRQAENLALMVGTLQAANVADGPTAIESAMSLQKQGQGRAENITDAIFAIAQASPGTMQDFFQVAGLHGQTLLSAGFDLNTQLAAYGALAKGGNLRGGAAGLRQMMVQLSREPDKRYRDFYSERTGGQWSDMYDIAIKEGLPALATHLQTFFSEDGDFFKLFGDVEGANAAALLASDPEELARLIAVAANSEGSINRFGEDVDSEFSQAIKRFAATWESFKTQFGEPFAKFVKPFINALRGVMEAMLRLNEATGGLFAWFTAIGGTLYLLPKVLRAFMGSMRLLSSSPLFGALRDLASGGKDGGKGKSGFDERSFGTGLGSGAAGGVVGATAAWGGAAFMRFFGSIKSAFTAFSTEIYNARLSMTQLMKGETGAIRFLFAGGVIAAIMKMLTFILGSTAVVGLVTALYARLRTGPLEGERIEILRAKDAQADYFRAGGVRGGEPAPGTADIAAAQRALAEAERDLLMQAFLDRVREILPESIRFMFDGLVEFISAIDGVFISLGNFFRELAADPRATISKAWDKWMELDAKFTSWSLRKLTEFIGGEVPEEAGGLANIASQSSSTNLGQPHITITREMAEQLGITGGDYSNIWNAPNVDKLDLPIPPSQVDPSAFGRGSSRFDDADIPNPPVNITMGDIIIQGEHADDRFDTAKKVQEAVRLELRNSADRIIQEMDWASP